MRGAPSVPAPLLAPLYPFWLLGVKAVRAGRVYSVPRWPHNWIDRPPSLMRVLGVQWLAGLFYPKLLPFDRLAHTRAFYQQVLGVSLSDSEIERLFQ